MRSILILAAHPDDESLACAGIIRRAILNKDLVNVVIVTNGDYLGKDIARLRYFESVLALEKLGLENTHLIWLGFADTGMDISESFLYRIYQSEGEQVFAPYSYCTYHPVDYLTEFSGQLWNRHLLYNKSSVYKCLDAVIQMTAPNDIYIPSNLDVHGDHKALNLIFYEMCKKDNRLSDIRRFEYIIHGGNDKQWPQRNSTVFTKPPILSNELWKMRIQITVPNDFNKLDVLKTYKSQISGSGYIESFSKTEEIFWMKGGIG